MIAAAHPSRRGDLLRAMKTYRQYMPSEIARA
jgi:hypothetical protein